MSTPITTAMGLPRIVIVGRPNVGKSTLFNRLFGRRRSLVHDLPGVTRDRIEEKSEWRWQGGVRDVVLVDTGGLGEGRFGEEIERQVAMALEGAVAVLLVFDAQHGLTSEDWDVVRKFQKAGVLKRVPVIGIANKVDDVSHEPREAEFYETGLDRVVGVSAEHGRGIDELRDVVGEMALAATEENVAEESSDDQDEVPSVGEAEESRAAARKESRGKDRYKRSPFPRVAIVGRPNVGKSTLTNALLGEERMVTSPIAGTTVDAVDSEVELDGVRMILVDTAGVRRKSRTEQGVEVLSVLQTKKALETADVALLLIDAEEGVTDQDEKIAGLIEEEGCGVIVIVNKWDLHESRGGKRAPTSRFTGTITKDDAAEELRSRMRFLSYAPIVFTSALKRRGIAGLGELIEEVIRQRDHEVSTHEFTEWVRREATVHNPANVRFYLCHPAGSRPPTFVCHVNKPEKVHYSLSRHLVNAIRARWGYMGNPVRVRFVSRQGKDT